MARAGVRVVAMALPRRGLLHAGASLAIAALSPSPARGSDRTPYGGRISLHVPWSLGRFDPHLIDDAATACFGSALFESLYARDETGTLRPSLAESYPESDGTGLRVTLRRGVRFASGRALNAQSAAASIERARAHDAGAWLVDVPRAKIDGDALVFPMRDVHQLLRGLGSPLVAIVPSGFVPERPDGTGPFRVEPATDGVRLARNALAASGPSFLDAIEIRHAPDLTTSLRAFESGADDIGWLGSFLHEPRTGARTFDAGGVAWAILRMGREAGPLDVPGMAQTLADGVPYTALAPLMVGPAWGFRPAQWAGPPAELLVRDDAPWLIEVARALAVSASTPSHEVVPNPRPLGEIARRRLARTFALMLDVACPVGPGDVGTLLGLATADDAASAIDLARHPPRGNLAARTLTRTMRIGLVGEIRLQGGRAPDIVLPPSPWGRGVDWGNAFRMRAGTRP